MLRAFAGAASTLSRPQSASTLVLLARSMSAVHVSAMAAVAPASAPAPRAGLQKPTEGFSMATSLPASSRLAASSALRGSPVSLRSAALARQGTDRLAPWAPVRCNATASTAAAEEQFTYQAEVTRLLDLIVHSLYSHREVFLRELVSNASDALDKLRFLSVTDASLMEGAPDMAIRIKADPEKGTLTITDSGIGMTKEELIDSLGTIAQSGTAKFVQALKEKQEKEGQLDSNLIGQFGVGFYSAFLVADKITVRTKSPKSEKQFVWEAVADNSTYVVREETEEDKMLPRGTSIELHLKEDQKEEYSQASRIQGLVKNYSQFISFPIYTWEEKTKDVEEEYEEAGKEGEEPTKKTRKVQQKYSDWELANETKPIWVRNPKEVEEKEYNEFCKSTFKEFMDPMAHSHFSTEGEIEFKSLLFVPGMAPFDQQEMFGGKTKNIRLYVKRVFISDEFDGDLFPRYLAFVKGVVDSNDLPLNVSREILQESRIVRVMKKRLVRKTLDMIDDIAKKEDKEAYKTFWSNFGRNIKLGCIEDTGNHKRLAPLLRFLSSKTSDDELMSLDQYVEGMKPGQKEIYYLAADNIKSAKAAPFLEKLNQKDLEVLLLVEPVDEVAVTSLATYKDFKFVDVSKEDLDLGDEVDEAKDREVEKEFQEVCDWMKTVLGEKVSKVQVSKRISSSPCVLVAGKFGWSANMERLMKAQSMADPMQAEFMRGRRILEINPDHPIIKDLKEESEISKENQRAKRMVDLLYETAHIAGGFPPENPSEFGSKVYEMMGQAIAAQLQEREAIAGMGKAKDLQGDGKTEVVEASEIRTEGDAWKA